MTEEYGNVPTWNELSQMIAIYEWLRSKEEFEEIKSEMLIRIRDSLRNRLELC